MNVVHISVQIVRFQDVVHLKHTILYLNYTSEKEKKGFSLNQNKDTEVYKISRHIEMQLRHIVVMSAEKYFKYL